MGFVGAFVGYREAEIVESRTKPLLALKYMVNLRKVESSGCAPNLWAMKSAIDEAIIEYYRDAAKICLICSLDKYAFLNDSKSVRQLLRFRISDLERGSLQREQVCSEDARISEKLEYFRNIEKEIR